MHFLDWRKKLSPFKVKSAHLNCDKAIAALLVFACSASPPGCLPPCCPWPHTPSSSPQQGQFTAPHSPALSQALPWPCVPSPSLGSLAGAVGQAEAAYGNELILVPHGHLTIKRF